MRGACVLGEIDYTTFLFLCFSLQNAQDDYLHVCFGAYFIEAPAYINLLSRAQHPSHPLFKTQWPLYSFLLADIYPTRLRAQHCCLLKTRVLLLLSKCIRVKYSNYKYKRRQRHFFSRAHLLLTHTHVTATSCHQHKYETKKGQRIVNSVSYS